MSQSKYSIKVIKEVSELERLRDDWRELAARFPTPLLQYEWFATCAAIFHRTTMHVVALREGDQLVAIAPLATQTVRGIKRLNVMGVHSLGEPTGFLYRDREALDALIRVIRSRHPLVVYRLPTSLPESQLLAEHSFGSFVRRTSDRGTPWIPITTNWNEFEAGISASRRSALRRARRRSEALGQIEITVTSRSAEELERHFDQFVAIEAKSWKGARGTDLASTPDLRRFYSSYLAQAAALGIARVAFFRIDGQSVAGQLGIEYAGRLWVLKISYDDAWSSCSPGMQLTHEMIRWSFEHSLNAYEFLGRDEPWIHVWRPVVRSHGGIIIYPPSVVGIYARLRDNQVVHRVIVATRHRLAQMRRRVRQGVMTSGEHWS
jgi:CelD/BcsL family acetyltransferase involved in cellulose biosynthesis